MRGKTDLRHVWSLTPKEDWLPEVTINLVSGQKRKKLENRRKEHILPLLMFLANTTVWAVVLKHYSHNHQEGLLLYLMPRAPDSIGVVHPVLIICISNNLLMLAAHKPQLGNHWDRVILKASLTPILNNSQWKEEWEGQQKALTSCFLDLTVCREVLSPSPLWPNRKLVRVSGAGGLWKDEKIPFYEAKEAAHYYLTFKTLSNFKGGK